MLMIYNRQSHEFAFCNVNAFMNVTLKYELLNKTFYNWDFISHEAKQVRYCDNPHIDVFVDWLLSEKLEGYSYHCVGFTNI